MDEIKTDTVNRGQTVEAAFATILRANLGAVEKWEPVACEGEDIEGVHKVRVGLRRTRSALTVFSSAIPRQATRPLAKELRRCGKALDRARDLDVYITETLCLAPDDKAAKKLRRIAWKHRERAYKPVRKLLLSKSFANLKSQFEQWVDSKGWQQTLSPEEKKHLRRRVTPFASQVLGQHRAQVLEDGKGIDTLDSEALHQLRIDCKKLRYATEFFAPLYGERMQDFTDHLKALQDLLGTLQDVAVLRVLHRDLLRGRDDAKLKRLARKLEKVRSEHAREIMTTAVERWTAFEQAETPWTPTRKPRTRAS